MSSNRSTSFLALAKRTSKEEIARQSDLASALPYMRPLLDAVPDMILILNKHRQAIFCNKTAFELSNLEDINAVYGLRPGELFSCEHSEKINGCGTTETCQNCGALFAILTGQQGRSDSQECRFTKKDGQVLDLRVWATPIKLGVENFTLIVLKDISDEKRRRVLERIFFHDINNIAARFQALEVIVNNSRPDHFEEICGHIALLTQELIEEIEAQQDLTAAEINELTVHPVSMSSREVMQTVVDLYKSHSGKSNQNIVIDAQSHDLQFVSDKTLLKRVLGNLVQNAIESSEPDRVVTLGCKKFNQQIQFRVHNEAYLSREIQLQIFQRSFSTKGAGRGLGTYSIKLLTERYLKGAVSFTTSPEAGTTFTVTYPLA